MPLPSPPLPCRYEREHPGETAGPVELARLNPLVNRPAADNAAFETPLSRSVTLRNVPLAACTQLVQRMTPDGIRTVPDSLSDATTFSCWAKTTVLGGAQGLQSRRKDCECGTRSGRVRLQGAVSRPPEW